MLKNGIALVFALLMTGCATLFFKTERMSLFTDVNNNRISVEYGTEEREETLPSGATLKFNRKVRITMPEGGQVVLYQTLSPSGVRYHTPDNEYIFIEQGPWCRLIKNGAVIYQGVFSRNCKIEKDAD